MKKFFVALSLFFGVGFLSCEDTTSQKEQIPESTLAHYRTIGSRISFETGMRWIDIYNENSSSSRNQLFGHYEISSDKALELITSVDGLVGVAFHYGKDALGQKHVIVIPVDNTMKLWTSIPGRIYVDANSGNTISQSTANAWAQNYKNQNPSAVWFHFFGESVFGEITALPYFDSIDIQPALNELLLPQMLLVIWNESLSSGRTASDDEWGAVYDASNPCPPCAVE
jgi:hypothetical protein